MRSFSQEKGSRTSWSIQQAPPEMGLGAGWSSVPVSVFTTFPSVRTCPNPIWLAGQPGVSDRFFISVLIFVPDIASRTRVINPQYLVGESKASVLLTREQNLLTAGT